MAASPTIQSSQQKVVRIDNIDDFFDEELERQQQQLQGGRPGAPRANLDASGFLDGTVSNWNGPLASSHSGLSLGNTGIRGLDVAVGVDLPDCLNWTTPGVRVFRGCRYIDTSNNSSEEGTEVPDSPRNRRASLAPGLAEAADQSGSTSRSASEFVLKHGSDVILTVPWARFVLLSYVVNRAGQSTSVKGFIEAPPNGLFSTTWPYRRLPMRVENSAGELRQTNARVESFSSLLEEGKKAEPAEGIVIGYLPPASSIPRFVCIRRLENLTALMVTLVNGVASKLAIPPSRSGVTDLASFLPRQLATLHQSMADRVYDEEVLEVIQPSYRDKHSQGIMGAIYSFGRNLVSKKKMRFQKDGFDLDLAYVTPNILAMGFPCIDDEARFRNPMAQVIKFLEKFHSDGADLSVLNRTMNASDSGTQANTATRIYPSSRTRHFLVVNLCSERIYSPFAFGGRFERYAFDDHEAPPLPLLMHFCVDAASFLLGRQIHPSQRQHLTLFTPEAQQQAFGPRVLAVHCKAGKGRTGTVIVALMLYLNMVPSLSDALRFYGEKRSKNGAGVTQASQLRFLQYFDRTLKELQGTLPRVRPVTLQALSISSPPVVDMMGGCTPYVVVERRRSPHLHRALGHSMVRCTSELEVIFDGSRSTSDGAVLKRWTPALAEGTRISLPLRGTLVTDEFRLTLWSKKTSALLQPKDELLFSCWLHASFLNGETGTWVGGRVDLDKVESHLVDIFAPDFRVFLHFAAKNPTDRVPEVEFPEAPPLSNLDAGPSGTLDSSGSGPLLWYRGPSSNGSQDEGNDLRNSQPAAAVPPAAAISTDEIAATTGDPSPVPPTAQSPKRLRRKSPPPPPPAAAPLPGDGSDEEVTTPPPNLNATAGEGPPEKKPDGQAMQADPDMELL
jgi:hypothetical protein